MKYQKYSEAYDKLEHAIHVALRTEIACSITYSDHIDTAVIKVNIFDYTELAVIHNELTFLDSDGQHYSLYAECCLEDLIDILTKI